MPSEITPKPLYLRRREFLQALPLAGRMVTTTDSPTPHRGVTTYNNFYEFGTDKSDPATYGNRFKPRPWSVTVSGDCAKPVAALSPCKTPAGTCTPTATIPALAPA